MSHCFPLICYIVDVQTRFSQDVDVVKTSTSTWACDSAIHDVIVFNFFFLWRVPAPFPDPVNYFDITTIKSAYLFYMCAYAKSRSNERIVLLCDVKDILYLS